MVTIGWRVWLGVGVLVASAGAAGAQEATPGFLGVALGEVPAGEDGRAYPQVTSVVPDTPAARGGLRAGDVVVGADERDLAGEPGEAVAAFAAWIRARGAGAEVVLRVRRVVARVVATQGDETRTELEGALGEVLEGVPELGALLTPEGFAPATLEGSARHVEETLKVVLGAPPEVEAVELGPNGALRPDLEEAALDAGAVLARDVIARARNGALRAQEAYEELRGRLEADEAQVQDGYRLDTVRYLRRDPHRLAGATRLLGRALARVLDDTGTEDEARGLWRWSEEARRQLGATQADLFPPPQPPELGASPEEHGQFALACARLAWVRVERALGGLDEDERAFLGEVLPGLAEAFEGSLYLHEDPDTARWARHRRAIALVERIDRAALLSALEALLPLSEAGYLSQLRQDLSAAEDAGVRVNPGTSAVRGGVLYVTSDPEIGRVLIGGSGDNVYREDAAVILDLGGDDCYHRRAGGAGPDRPAGVVVDLGGDDRYQATEDCAQGAAMLGVALLVDLSGDDVYTSSARLAQGSALAGAALLFDGSGHDTYRCATLAQGAALLNGSAGLVDAEGDDLWVGGLYTQGFAGPGSFGVLLSGRGDDRYLAQGVQPSTYEALDPGFQGMYHSFSQGASSGFRWVASGGVAALVDLEGRDRYEAGNFSQGGGYYFGWGSLIDLGARDDLYEGSRYAQGFAAHSAVGSLWDQGGDDRYRGWVGAQQSAAWDLSVTCFLDDAGDDRYAPGPGFSIGASAHNGYALFVDRGGHDRYGVAPGRAHPNDYHGGPSVSVFVDAGGEADRYDAGGLADNLAAVHAEHPGEVGVVMDLSGDVGDGLRAFGYFPWRSSPPQQPEDPEAPDAPEDESNGPRRF